jgi:adenosylcobinamide-GDP ribazoletransferase
LIRGMRSAVAFLTVLPIGGRKGGESPGEGGIAWYGAVGALVGVLLGATMAGAWELWSPLVAAALTVVAWAIITGGLHLDGLADTADAGFAAVPRERRLEILRDVHHGTFAVVAVALVLLLKFSLLASPRREDAVAALLVAPTIARAAVVLVASRMAPARAAGLGRGFRDEAGVFPMAACFAFAMFAALVAFGWVGLIALAAGLGFAALLSAGLRLRFGGMTGDLLGALIELTEVAVLLAGAAILQHGPSGAFPVRAWL